MDKLQLGKQYRIKVADGREITNKCIEISSDSVAFKARNLQLKFSKSEIESIERRRNSPITYIVGIAIPAAIVLSVITNEEESVFEQTRPK